jgi:hypothetical protein
MARMVPSVVLGQTIDNAETPHAKKNEEMAI